MLHKDLAEFVRFARPLYDTDPLSHTIALTVLDAMIGAGETAAVTLTVQERGTVRGAVLRTVGRSALVSGLPPDHAPDVVGALTTVDPELPGATGPVAEVEAFAAAYCAVTGSDVDVVLRTRLFALGTLVPPIGVPGAARLATAADLDLLGEWRAAFSDEIVGPDHRRDWSGPLTPPELVARSLQLGAGELLWEVDGTVVAQASTRRPVAGMSRIGPVYTPPEHRRHGYAAAVTAAASRWALDAGATRVLLFTDLANPTTNALYPRLGYRPVHDAEEVRFVAPARRSS